MLIHNFFLFYMLIAPFILKYLSFFFLAPFSCLLLLLPVILSVPNQKNLLLVISIQFSLYILVFVQGRPESLVPRKKKNIIIKEKERYLIACHLFVNLFG